MNGRKNIYNRKFSSAARATLASNIAKRLYVKKTASGMVYKPTYVKSGMKQAEKKYHDRTMWSDTFETLTGNPNGTAKEMGVTYVSNAWRPGSFNGIGGAPNEVSNDLLRYVETGTTARTRVGNKVKGIYVKGAMTFSAASVNGTLVGSQGGEQAADVAAGMARVTFLRTTIRMCIVKDMQVMSTSARLGWQDVFETVSANVVNGGQAGVHSEQKVDDITRFMILKDETFVLDADDPQTTVKFFVSPGQIGSIDYRGAAFDALTSRGIYIIWAAYVSAAPMGGNAADIEAPTCAGHSRFCFTDI